jgi:FkbH-like protein
MTASHRPSHCLLLSDFNVENLAGFLANDPLAPVVTVELGTFGQVLPTLLNAADPVWQRHYDAAVIWTRPEAVLESFGAVLENRPPPLDRLLGEVDQYCEALAALRERVSVVLVPGWVVPPWHPGLGLLDFKEQGIAATLAEINLRLARNLRDVPNYFVLGTERWVQRLGSAPFSPQLWHMGKIPFTHALFKLAAGEIKAALRAVAGLGRKLLILDLDDTLWGGIVGDVGWQELRLGGHDPLGEAFVDFQRALKALQNRGVVLAIVSKNDEATALEAIERHPAMLLRKEDFVGWRINWGDKAANLVELVRELNLGLDSVVFIDDSATERARIRESLPDVLVPDWPAEKMLYAQALAQLNCFDSAALTREDATRTQMYRAERARDDLQREVPSLEGWLEKLQLRVEIEPLGPANLKRATQLLNKTNQMNLTTRRMTESEYSQWADADGHRVWCVQVADRFGEYGLTGLIGVQWTAGEGRVVDFVLSCRVFGRQIEHVMLGFAVRYLAAQGVGDVRATYLATTKNKVCLDFWEKSGFEAEANQVFHWPAKQPFPAPPPFITVTERPAS